MLSVQFAIKNPQSFQSAKLNSLLHFLIFLICRLCSSTNNNLKYKFKHVNFSMPRASIQKRGNEHLKRRFGSAKQPPVSDNMIFNSPIIFFCLFYWGSQQSLQGEGD
ncbi:hypothetical protein SAMN05518854_11839 [Variovorax sp. YR266]|nr:hypothetical protein SAMN05518854_11839 [Variovorax sp. YR266]